ncbi:hypothetical protein PPACK8108_LOCUS22931 [Phakopsora pachyrhizi]|uniref:Uncharacterized protein n=1 Tax=Phakopsora pachyrhizi TaxID=170000 RepID=A0AAV0BPS1_PHAPC|nr:hypothetical protein PPACK8108_LOCUS22931 [Phakopsora pachyrhizi]
MEQEEVEDTVKMGVEDEEEEMEDHNPTRLLREFLSIISKQCDVSFAQEKYLTVIIPVQS